MSEHTQKDLYGYIYASPQTQEEQSQRNALLACGIPEERIYTDVATEDQPGQAAYRDLLRQLRSGDRLVITEIGCLGSSYSAMLKQWRTLTVDKSVRMTVLDLPYLSTLTDRGAVDSLVSEITLELLTYLGEREGGNRLHHQRQAKGIASAKARGVRFGRPTLPVPEGFEPLREQWEAGEITATAAAKQLGVATGTFLKWAKNPPVPSAAQETQQVEA